eukprot:2014633-Rhodomonas_salina.4
MGACHAGAAECRGSGRRTRGHWRHQFEGRVARPDGCAENQVAVPNSKGNVVRISGGCTHFERSGLEVSRFGPPAIDVQAGAVLLETTAAAC